MMAKSVKRKLRSTKTSSIMGMEAMRASTRARSPGTRVMVRSGRSARIVRIAVVPLPVLTPGIQPTTLSVTTTKSSTFHPSLKYVSLDAKKPMATILTIISSRKTALKM